VEGGVGGGGSDLVVVVVEGVEDMLGANASADNNWERLLVD
jgi:hypothetical protein